MAIIDTVIPISSLERIRDAIGSILADEISNQSILTQTSDPEYSQTLSSVKVFSERIKPFNDNELPSINILFVQGDFDNKGRFCKRANYNFLIDVYIASKGDQDSFGDSISAKNGLRILNLVNKILEFPSYMTLGFDLTDSLVQNSILQSVKLSDPSNNRDALNVLLYRCEFMVVSAEKFGTLDGIPFSAAQTNVEINDSGVGLEYTINN